MPDEYQFDVFLSHSTKDKPVVRELAARLKKDGVRVWLDEEQIKPGDSIPAKIEEALERSRVLVLCMSENAFGSDWAQLELGTFRFRDPLNKDRRFIPLRLDDAPIKGSLAQFLYINWRLPNNEQEYAKLLEACRSGNTLRLDSPGIPGWQAATKKEIVLDRDTRDDFQQKVKDILAKRVGFLCSNPSCKCPTTGPHTNPRKAINVGVAAHIAAAAHGGPRYDASMSQVDRSSIQNGIWLCQNCAKLIDNDEARYTAPLLCQWKAAAEQAALQRVETGTPLKTVPALNEHSSHVQIVHSGSGDIVIGTKSTASRRVVFSPGPQHIAPETARQLRRIVDEIVERLTVSGGNTGKAYARVWGDFNAEFGLTTYKELPREKAEAGISYLRQWRASKNSRLRNADPEKFRTAQLKGIWPRSKSLGFADSDLYAFASKKLKLPHAITSLNELGNQQLSRLNRFLIYEERKFKKQTLNPRRGTERTNHGSKLEVTASLALENTNTRQGLLTIKAVNFGSKVVRIRRVAVALKPDELIKGSGIVPVSSELNIGQKQAVVNIEADEDMHEWQQVLRFKPNFEVHEKESERYGKGYIELTSGKKVEFEFLLLPDSAWDFLTASIAPVFDGKMGHKCSHCGFIFLTQATAISVTCPKCKRVDHLRPNPSTGVSAKYLERAATAASAIWPCYLKIIGSYQDCALLIEDKNMEKLRARQQIFQTDVNQFWQTFELNKIYLPQDIENDVRVIVNTCDQYVRTCDRVQTLIDSKPTEDGQKVVDAQYLKIEKLENDIIAMRPKTEAHFRRLIAGK